MYGLAWITIFQKSQSTICCLGGYHDLGMAYTVKSWQVVDQVTTADDDTMPSCREIDCNSHTICDMQQIHFTGLWLQQYHYSELLILKSFQAFIVNKSHRLIAPEWLTELFAKASYLIRKTEGLRMHQECRERLPCHRHQRKPLVNYPGMHHGTCVTHVPWCMSGSLTRGGGENVPGIPGACATRNFTQEAHVPGLSPQMCAGLWSRISPVQILSRVTTQC